MGLGGCWREILRRRFFRAGAVAIARRAPAIPTANPPPRREAPTLTRPCSRTSRNAGQRPPTMHGDSLQHAAGSLRHLRPSRRLRWRRRKPSRLAACALRGQREGFVGLIPACRPLGGDSGRTDGTHCSGRSTRDFSRRTERSVGDAMVEPWPRGPFNRSTRGPSDAAWIRKQQPIWKQLSTFARQRGSRKRSARRRKKSARVMTPSTR